MLCYHQIRITDFTFSLGYSGQHQTTKMDNEFTSNITSIQRAAANRKQILSHLNQQVNEQADRIKNAQQEIAAVKKTLGDALQRLERIKNRDNQSK